jgi:hypothetical protein
MHVERVIPEIEITSQMYSPPSSYLMFMRPLPKLRFGNRDGGQTIHAVSSFAPICMAQSTVFYLSILEPYSVPHEGHEDNVATQGDTVKGPADYRYPLTTMLSTRDSRHMDAETQPRGQETRHYSSEMSIARMDQQLVLHIHRYPLATPTRIPSQGRNARSTRVKRT